MNTTPYTFTIKNTCTTFISYDVIFLVDSESTLDPQYVDVVLDRNVIKTLDQYESREIDGQTGYILQSGNLSQADETTYNLRMWLDEEVTVNDPVFNTSLKGKIRIEAKITNYSPIDQGFKTLADAMLVNEYQSSSVEAAKDQIEAKQAPDFSKTAPIIEWIENHASNTTEVIATMPHPDLLHVEEDYTANLTSENILPVIGTGYSFSSETGTYTLNNIMYVDPTTLNYNGDTNYYFCGAGFNTNSSDLITPYQNSSNCAIIYQIVSTSSSDGTLTGSGGTSIKTKVYLMTAYRYSQSEQESDQSDKGLYMMEDQDGKSYYYRGNVNNNYVYFAGYYWRIIRQNGDGSIRLLYAGTSANATGEDAQIGTTPFNSQRNSPAYVGYMYGNDIASSSGGVIANDINSDIKDYLDEWYQSNLIHYMSYLSDNGFCNDRSFSHLSNNVTYYSGRTRIFDTQEPLLICSNASNDLFTVSNEKGNQALTYPIGLITMDELMLAGYKKSAINKSSYVYSGGTYWTMTPSNFNANTDSAYSFCLRDNGVSGDGNNVSSNFGIRPVINLASNVEIESGIGTVNDPYVIKVM